MAKSMPSIKKCSQCEYLVDVPEGDVSPVSCGKPGKEESDGSNLASKDKLFLMRAKIPEDRDCPNFKRRSVLIHLCELAN